MVRVAINGFGRIGRLAYRRISEISNDIEVVAVNDLTNPADLAYLLKYDTRQGRYDHEVEAKDDALVIDGKEVKVFSEMDASNCPWGELDIDIVLESTGHYTSAEKSQAHLDAGAKKVLISAPAKDDVTKMIVYGVNDDTLEADDKIISAASCTTNCLAPVVNVLDKEFGVKVGNMATIHAFTATQALQDMPGGRKSRAAADNIIPASTGAAKATGKVVPSVNGLVDGGAFRVPTITGSLVLFFGILKKNTTEEEVNAAMKKYTTDSFQYTEDEIVSSDVIGYPAGSVFDASQTKILEAEDGTQLVQVASWYDNEAGFTSNMVRLLEKFGGQK
ncbi:MAG: type I glyceraldehyde-3-phosphate dehydrogenase [Aerococcus sp.]|nr:type I glyceraldehyde-3-phosphate dehydrogenase [Aerococcus sp.]